MDTDRLTSDLQAVLERCASVLNQEIARTKKAVDALNGEKATAQAELVQLHAQRTRVQNELDAITKQLGPAQSLVALNSEIAKAKAELKKLQGETEKVSTALEGLVKERRAAEGQVIELRTQANNWAASRAQTEAAIRSIRERFFG